MCLPKILALARVFPVCTYHVSTDLLVLTMRIKETSNYGNRKRFYTENIRFFSKSENRVEAISWRCAMPVHIPKLKISRTDLNLAKIELFPARDDNTLPLISTSGEL